MGEHFYLLRVTDMFLSRPTSGASLAVELRRHQQWNYESREKKGKINPLSVSSSNETEAKVLIDAKLQRVCSKGPGKSFMRPKRLKSLLDSWCKS